PLMPIPANRPERLLLLCFVAGALAVRLIGIQSKALWWNEGINIWLAGLSLPDYLDVLWIDIHPPFYRLLMLAYVHLSGPSDFATRLFSAWLGVLAVPLTYQLARPGYGVRTACLAAALMALSPLAVYHSQEVNMYTLLLVFGAVGLVATSRLFAGRRASIWWWAYVGSMSLGLWTHYYAATNLAAVNLAYGALWAGRSKGLPGWRAWGAAQTIVVATYLPWVALAGGRIPADADRTIGGASLRPTDFAVNIWSALSIGSPLQPVADAWALALLCALLAAGGLLIRPECLGQRALLASAIIVPMTIGILVSFRFPYDAPRFFIILTAACGVLVAAGCRLTARRWPRWAPLATAGALATAAAGTLGVYHQPSLTDDYRPLIRRLAAEGQTGDVVLCTYPWHVGYVQAYAPGDWQLVFPVPEDVDVSAGQADRIWILYYQTPEGAGDYLRQLLEARSFERTVSSAHEDGRIALFVRRAGA
ncbi:MAG TPA: glycosyltransferase family 39 protein, partial [Dehalococcoidia bacterium]|nr:glycosyltransferase family 39 protein [Dehalococcoidia bacterium]